MWESDDDDELLQAALRAEDAASATSFSEVDAAGGAKRARLAEASPAQPPRTQTNNQTSDIPVDTSEPASASGRNGTTTSMPRTPRASQPQGASATRCSGRSSDAVSPVDALAERLQNLALRTQSGCISGPGLVSCQPCPLIQQHARYKLNFGGIEVLFPFEQPLEPQRAVIQNVLEALVLGKHAVLESPTGTGKTAAVLCACLAWQRHRMSKTGSAPQLMYATRTHAQVRQAIRELRRTPYRPITAVLGSRGAGLCIKDEVLRSSEDDGQLRQACRQARQQKTCSFHEGLAFSNLPDLANARLRGSEPWDIEDMAQFGSSTNSCPYYVAHSIARHAELVFCPYSYVLDPSVRQAAGLSCADLSGRIVVLDEAHNVEGVCRDAGSAEISLDQARNALAVIKRWLGEDGEKPPASAAAQRLSVPLAAATSSEELGGFMVPATVSAAFDMARSDDGALAVERRRKTASMTSTLRPLCSLLGRICGFLGELNQAITYAPHLPEHRQVSAFLRALKLDSEPLLRPDPACRSPSAAREPRGEALLREIARGSGASGAQLGAQLELAASLLGQLAAAARSPDLYVIHARPEGQGQRPALQTWLMSAEGTFASLVSELHSMLLMSGTLSPLPATISELGPTFQSRALPALAANHVVGRSALTVVSVAQALPAADSKLECTFHAWKRPSFLHSIGTALVTLCRAIPAGILVFLPSYDLLERCMATWDESPCNSSARILPNQRRASGKAKAKRRSRGAVERLPEEISKSGPSILDQLKHVKGTIVVEPAPMCQQSTASAARVYEAAKQRYEIAVSQAGQALLLAVYRGRMSEGVSFDDDFARGVVCIGIPFPNLTEERIAQKRACNDFWTSRSLGAVSGDAWYESKALHAVAQALGRCIRHPNDFGALVLLDSRWAELGNLGRVCPAYGGSDVWKPRSSKFEAGARGGSTPRRNDGAAPLHLTRKVD